MLSRKYLISMGTLILMSMGHFSSMAQENSLLYFGSINFSKYGGTSDQKVFNLNLGIGYQFNPFWTAGLEGAFASSKVGNGSVRNGYSFGPFIRAEMPINDQFSTFVQVGGGYSRLDYANLNGFYVQFFPAIKWHIHKGFALNLSTGAISYKKTGDSNEFNINYGLVPTLGVSYNMTFKKKTDNTQM